MASIKDNTEGAMRNIHKLLSNTPYGRLGMNNDRDVAKTFSLKQFEFIELCYNIKDSFFINENKVYVKHSKYPDKIKCEQSGINYEKELLKIVDGYSVNNSTAAAAAISS
jgi:hypothetical protein